ncbi:hypothetical protein FI667_g1371, partial [Globisporangium splendens]
MAEKNPREFDVAIEKAKTSVKTMLVGASMTGAGGAMIGAVLAALRNESIKFYSASMGANFFLLSSTYIALEEVIADKTGKKDLKTGAGAGLLTGGFYAGIVGGRVRGLQGAAAGAAVGAAVIFGREQFQRWRLSKAIERYEEKYGTAPAMYYPNTDILVETKGPVRELEFPSLLPKSIKITDDEIERRIQVRVEELRQEAADTKNVPPSSAVAST